MELFKYCKRAHVPLAHSKGAVLVGTLFDFQKTDKYGELVADLHEGSKSISGTATNLNSANVHLYPGLKGLVSVGSGATIGRINVANYTVSCQNMFVFSTAQKYSREEHERWYAAEGYDACYRISSARLFFRELSRVLGARGKLVGVEPIHYAETLDLSASDIHPALVKRQMLHQSQQEVRALWQPAEGMDVEPILLAETAVGLYCTLHQTIGSV